MIDENIKQATALIWNIKKEDTTTRSNLHHKLFGYKKTIVKKIKDNNKFIKTEETKYYNGLLTFWDNGVRKPAIYHEALGDSIIIIPKIYENKIPEILFIFKKLGIIVRELHIIENKVHYFYKIK